MLTLALRFFIISFSFNALADNAAPGLCQLIFEQSKTIHSQGRPIFNNNLKIDGFSQDEVTLMFSQSARNWLPYASTDTGDYWFVHCENPTTCYQIVANLKDPLQRPYFKSIRKLEDPYTPNGLAQFYFLYASFAFSQKPFRLSAYRQERLLRQGITVHQIASALNDPLGPPVVSQKDYLVVGRLRRKDGPRQYLAVWLYGHNYNPDWPPLVKEALPATSAIQGSYLRKLQQQEKLIVEQQRIPLSGALSGRSLIIGGRNWLRNTLRFPDVTREDVVRAIEHSQEILSVENPQAPDQLSPFGSIITNVGLGRELHIHVRVGRKGLYVFESAYYRGVPDH